MPGFQKRLEVTVYTAWKRTHSNKNELKTRSKTRRNENPSLFPISIISRSTQKHKPQDSKKDQGSENF